MSIMWSVIIGIIFFIISVNSSVNVLFNIPKLFSQNIPYSLFIQSNSQEKFPFENFLLSFEIINPTNNETVGVAAITSSEYKGDSYRGFSIGQFVIQERTMEMKLTFRIEAYDKLLIIRYGTEDTEEKKQAFFDDKTKGIIFNCKIDLYVPYKITMQAMPDIGVISHEDKEGFGYNLIADKYGVVICEATEGLPKVNPQFVNADILKGATAKLIKTETNSLQWKVLLEDNGKIIQCKAGDDLQNLTLTVYHYVSEVMSSPPIADKVSRKSQIKCISKDGYPTPKNTWTFINGPIESWKYYQLRDNNVTLFINSSAPISSNWSFECRGSNDMPLVVQKYLQAPVHNSPIKKMFNFTIIDSDNNVQTSQIGIVIVVVFMIVLVVIAVLCVMNREKVRDLFNRLLRPIDLDKHAGVKQTTEQPIYKYSEINTCNPQRNGTEDTAYADIVGIVQTKSNRDFGPIDRV